MMFFLLWLPLVVFSGHADTDTIKECEDEKVSNNTFKAGEQVTYKVYYNWKSVWLGAGEVDFSVKQKFKNNRRYFHLVATGETYTRYDWFYKVRDKYESTVHPETVMPIYYKRDVNEGGYTINNEFFYNREEDSIISHQQNWKTPHHVDTIGVSECTQDVLSAIYYARCIDYDQYEPNDKIPMNIFLDDKEYSIYIRYLGKERIKVKGSKYETIKFSPLLIEGTIFEEGEGMTVWVTNDKNKIPVLVKSPIVVGSVKAVLKDYEGIKHDFTATVD